MKRRGRMAGIIGVLALGWLAGMVQGSIQSDREWHQRIVERSTAFDQEGPVPVYEDTEGNVYYSHREQRNLSMIPREGLAR